MKEIWKDLCLAATLGLVVPGMILAISVRMDREEAGKIGFSPSETEEVAAATVAETEPVPPQYTIRVRLSAEEVVPMELESYISGVVLAEMPVSFHQEALKAQAVVARTYAIRADSGFSKHPDAAVCTEPACCQAYLSAAEYQNRGGTEREIETVKAAVSDTRDMVLFYDNQLIEATYFSCSGGSTEDAVAVWGTAVPYLQATASHGEENAAHYTDTVTFTKDQFSRLMGIPLPSDSSRWIGPITRTAGGGVDTITVGGVSFKGTVVRKALGLRSTAFTVEVNDSTVTVTTKGFGHRVGMSQYGANAMAESGSDYQQILAHYYAGTQLKSWLVDK